MKKVLMLIFTILALGLASCNKNCICVNPEGDITEVDIFFADECANYSTDELGNCN